MCHLVSSDVELPLASVCVALKQHGAHGEDLLHHCILPQIVLSLFTQRQLSLLSLIATRESALEKSCCAVVQYKVANPSPSLLQKTTPRCFLKHPVIVLTILVPFFTLQYFEATILEF